MSSIASFCFRIALFIALLGFGVYQAGAAIYDNTLNRYSYNWEDETCTSANASLGYSRTEKMETTNWLGYFNPVMNLRHGASFFDMFCSHLTGPQEVPVDSCKHIGVNWGCVRYEIARTEPYPDSQFTLWEEEMLSAAPDEEEEALRNAEGKYGALYEEEQVVCAYIHWAGCPSPEDCGVYNWYNTATFIKCIRIPLPPPPPPFCDMIMSGQQVRAVYQKPVDTKTNTYFSPMIKLISSLSKKRCDDGSVVDVGINCPDGSDGNLESVDDSYIHVGDINVYERKETIMLGGADYTVYSRVSEHEICADGHYGTTGSRTFLGCFPRNTPLTPKMDVMGVYAEDPADDELLIRVTPPEQPPDPFTDAEKMTITEIMDGLIVGDDPREDYYGMRLSSVRVAWKPYEDEKDNTFIMKRICILDTDEYGLIDAEQQCDDVYVPEIVDAYDCRDGTYAENKNECSDPDSAVSVQMKQCQGGYTYVPMNQKCDPGRVEYDDDPDGLEICLRGFIHANEQFYIERIDAGTGEEYNHYFVEAPKMLIPVTVINGEITPGVGDPVDINAVPQETLDTMVYSRLGYYTIQVEGTPRDYVFQRLSYTHSDGVTTTSYIDVQTGLPFFLSLEERDKVLPADPVRYGLCQEIPEDNLPGRKSFTVIYNNMGLYIGDTLDVITEKNSNAPEGASKNFQDYVYYNKNDENGPELPWDDIEEKDPIDLEDYPEMKENAPYPDDIDHQQPHAWWFENEDFREDIESTAVYLLDKEMDTSGCSTVTFEMWGSGAQGESHRHAQLNRGNRTWDFFENDDRCHYGSLGENGAYAKGTFNLKRGSVLAVLLARDDNSYYYSGGNREGGSDSGIWVSEDGKPFKLLIRVRGGHRYGPMDYDKKPSKYLHPRDNPRYKGILKDKGYQVEDYGQVVENRTPGVYEYPGIEYDKDRIRLLEYRDVNGSTYCGASNSSRLGGRVTAFGPLNLVDLAGNAVAHPIGADIFRNHKDTEINNIGSWLFIHQEHLMQGDDYNDNREEICVHVQRIGDMNTDSFECLRYLTKTSCVHKDPYERDGTHVQVFLNSADNRDASGRYTRVPSERCRGMGGGSLSPHSVSSQSEIETNGQLAYAKITCN